MTNLKMTWSTASGHVNLIDGGGPENTASFHLSWGEETYLEANETSIPSAITPPCASVAHNTHAHTIQILRMRRMLDGDLWVTAKKKKLLKKKNENEAEFIPRAFPLENPSNKTVREVWNSWVSRDVTSFAQVSVRHVGVPRVSNLC